MEPISITDRYKLIFEEHHYASDFRVKLIQGWCLFYAAFAAGFAWAQNSASAKPVSWILSVFAIVITLFMWAADFRHRNGLANSKQIGEAIEEEAGIPANQRYFTLIRSGWLTHSLDIDVLSGFMIGAFLRVSIFLRSTGGDLKSLPTYLVWWAICGGALGLIGHLIFDSWLHRAETKFDISSHPTQQAPVSEREPVSE